METVVHEKYYNLDDYSVQIKPHVLHRTKFININNIIQVSLEIAIFHSNI